MNSPNQLKFNLDEPAENQEFGAGEILVRGWALSPDNDVSISAKVGQSSPVDIPYGKPRSDIAVAYPTERNALNSGFSRRIPAAHLTPGEYELSLQIRTAADRAPTEVHRKFRIADWKHSEREAFASSDLDTIRIRVDEPAEDSVILRGSVLKVTGWAIAKTGIEQVKIWLDEQGPHVAHSGMMREDISAVYEDFPGASHPGFLWVGKTDRLSPGLHQVKVVCESKSGGVVQAAASFEIDPKSEYDHWSRLNDLTGEERLELLESGGTLLNAPKISIVTPVFKTPERFLMQCVESVKKQVYPNWELILVDDGSRDFRLTALLTKFAHDDRRIRVETLSSNLGIAGATNAGIDLCTGDYVAFLDHDDELAPDALFSVVRQALQDPSIDVFYSDEDKIDEDGLRRWEPFFKPAWSPDLLLSMNYVCHFLVCRRELLQRIGGLRLGFDGSQDYDLILRLSEQTSSINRIPKVLYHWRSHQNSTAGIRDQKPAASEAGRRALEQHLQRRGIEARVEQTDIGRFRVRYAISGRPEVAVIVPTGGSPTLETALNSVLSRSSYKNFRVVVVDNSRAGVSERVREFMGAPQPVELVDCRNLPFNFSRLCNQAARATASEYLLFLNDDTSIITPDWIESMLEHAQREQVGAVGSLLLFPNGTIQHAGVVSGLFEFAGHGFRGLPDQPFYFDLSHVIRNCSAVTGACLMTSRDAFNSVQGFDEANLPTCFQDVDLCLKMLEKGYRIVYTPFAKLFHFESFSKKAVADLPELNYMKQRWASYIRDDPFYNPNLTRCAEDYSLRYDTVFLDHQENGSAARSGLRSAVTRKLGRVGQIKFYAARSQGEPDTRGLNRATIVWDVPGPEKVQIRVGSPMGTVFVEGRPSGSATTGSWVSPGLVFYLLDATESSAGSPDKVLSVLQF